MLNLKTPAGSTENIITTDINNIDPRLRRLAAYANTLELIVQTSGKTDYEKAIIYCNNSSTRLTESRTRHMSINSSLEFTPTSEYHIQVGVEIRSTSEYAYSLCLVGNSFGLAIGGAYGLSTHPGNYLLGVLNGVDWRPTTYSIGTGFHTLNIFYSDTRDSLYYYMDGAYLGAVTTTNAQAATEQTRLFQYDTGNTPTSSGITVKYIILGKATYPINFDTLVSQASVIFPAGVTPELYSPAWLPIESSLILPAYSVQGKLLGTTTLPTEQKISSKVHLDNTIDWSNPHTRGLRNYWLPTSSNTLVDVISGSEGVSVNAPLTTPTPNNETALSFTSTSLHRVELPKPTQFNVPSGTPFTFVFRVRLTSEPNAGALFHYGDGTANNRFGIWVGDNVTGAFANELITVAHIVGGGASIAAYCTATRTELYDGKIHTIMITSNGTLFGIALDGVGKGTTNNGTNTGRMDVVGATTAAVGAGWTGVWGAQLNGEVISAGFWVGNQHSANAAMSELAKDHWQLLREIESNKILPNYTQAGNLAPAPLPARRPPMLELDKAYVNSEFGNPVFVFNPKFNLSNLVDGVNPTNPTVLKKLVTGSKHHEAVAAVTPPAIMTWPSTYRPLRGGPFTMVMYGYFTTGTHITGVAQRDPSTPYNQASLFTNVNNGGATETGKLSLLVLGDIDSAKRLIVTCDFVTGWQCIAATWRSLQNVEISINGVIQSLTISANGTTVTDFLHATQIMNVYVGGGVEAMVSAVVLNNSVSTTVLKQLSADPALLFKETTKLQPFPQPRPFIKTTRKSHIERITESNRRVPDIENVYDFSSVITENIGSATSYNLVAAGAQQRDTLGGRLAKRFDGTANQVLTLSPDYIAAGTSFILTIAMYIGTNEIGICRGQDTFGNGWSLGITFHGNYISNNYVTTSAGNVQYGGISYHTAPLPLGTWQVLSIMYKSGEGMYNIHPDKHVFFSSSGSSLLRSSTVGTLIGRHASGASPVYGANGTSRLGYLTLKDIAGKSASEGLVIARQIMARVASIFANSSNNYSVPNTAVTTDSGIIVPPRLSQGTIINNVPRVRVDV